MQLHELSTAHVVSALRADRISSRRLSFPFADRRKLDQAVAFEVEGDVALDLDQVVVDWAIVGGDKSRAEVVASIAPRAEVSELIETLRAAGCEPRTLEAEGFVLGNLAAAFDLPGTRLLVDLGHRKTTFCLLLDGKAVAARSVPVAGAALTEALAKDRLLGLADAERAKCEEGVFGGSLADAPAAHRRRARHARARGRAHARRLRAAVRRAARSRSSRCSADRRSSTASTSTSSERTGLAAARLGLPTPGGVDGLAASGSPLLYAPAIALALRGTAQASTRMNFRQDEFAVRLDLARQLRDFRPTLWLAGAAALLAVISFGTSTAARGAPRLRGRGAGGRALDARRSPSKPVPENLLAGPARRGARGQRARRVPRRLRRQPLRARRADRDLEARAARSRRGVRGALDRQADDPDARPGQELRGGRPARVELAKFAPFAQARIGAIETDNKTGAKRFNVTISLAPEAERA